MSYRDPEPPRANDPLRKISWGLVAIGAVLIAFLTWHQIVMYSTSKKYGIEVSWVSLLLFFLLFVGLEIGAFFAAQRDYHGVSACLSGFVVFLLGIMGMLVIAQVGM
jgi:hypothetical protein